MEKTGGRLLIGALNLLAIGVPMLAAPAAHATPLDHKMDKLNVASLKSMESTWLKVPMACKARGFNGDAVSLPNKEARASVQAIYSLYQA